MNGPHPRGSIKPKSGWSLVSQSASRGKLLKDMHLIVTNVKGDAASHKMTEDDCIELGLALLQRACDLRRMRRSR